MRTMMRIHIDAIEGSQALKAGAMQKAIGAFMEKFKPEAAYFTVDGGMRTGLFVFSMEASHQQPEAAEAFFDLGCKVTLTPCMTPEDLQVGFAATGL
jgi:hypothetical protein